MKFLLKFLCVFLLSIYGFSQETFEKKYLTKNYTALDGLPSNEVRSLFRDTRGILWIGTKSGISTKYFGKITLFQPAVDLEFSNVLDITSDSAKNIWFASYGQGILFYDGTKAVRYTKKDGLLSNYTTALFSFGEYIYAGSKKGFSRIHTKTFKIQNFRVDHSSEEDLVITDFFTHKGNLYFTTKRNGVYSFINDRIIEVNNLKDIYRTFITNDTIYVSRENNIEVYKTISFLNKQLPLYSLPSKQVWDFYKTKKEHIIYAASNAVSQNDGGIKVIEGKKITDKTSHFDMADFKVFALEFDEANKVLMIGSQNNGLYQVYLNNKAEYYPYKKRNIIDFHHVKGRMYIMHSEGLSVMGYNDDFGDLKLEDFKRFQQKKYRKWLPLLKSNTCFQKIDTDIQAKNILFYKSMLVNNQLWISSNIGVFQLDNSGLLENYYPILTNQFTLFQGQFIATTSDGGIQIFTDIETLTYKNFSCKRNSDVPKNVVNIVQNENTVLFASATDGLFKYENGVFYSFYKHTAFTEQRLKKIVYIDENRFLVATEFNKLFFIEKKGEVYKVVKSRFSEKIKGNSIDLLAYYQGKVLVGTNYGLNIFNDKTTRLIDKDQGFFNSIITSYYLESNYIIVGTTEGFFAIDLTDVATQNHFSDNLRISDITIQGKPYTKDFCWGVFKEKTLQLSYQENSIDLGFLIGKVEYPEKLSFRYRLKPNEEWSPYFTDPSIKLSYIEPDEYQVEIEVNNLDTGYIEIVQPLTIIINPPFYKTWKFLFAVFLFSSLLVFLLLRYRISVLKKKHRKEQELQEYNNAQKLKTIQLERRITNTKLEALRSQMNPHFIFNVLNSLQNYIIDNDVDNALYFLSKFSKLTRETLNFSTLQFITLKEDLDFIKLYIDVENMRLDYPVSLHIKKNLDFNENDLMVPPMIMQPIVENCIKHAFTRQITQPVIEISVEMLFSKLVIRIKDNGIGYVNQKKENYHESKGIAMVKERLNLLHNEKGIYYTAESSEKGTVITLILPIEIAFTKQK